MGNGHKARVSEPHIQASRTVRNDDHIDATAQALANANKATPAGDDQARVLDLRRQLKDCDAKLAKYRALLEHDSDITVAARWIAEVERERRNLERELGRKPTQRRLTQNEIKAMVAQLRDVVAVLADANPVDKRIIYDQIGVKLTYRSDGTVHVAAGAPHVLGVGVGGVTRTITQRGDLVATFVTAA